MVLKGRLQHESTKYMYQSRLNKCLQITDSHSLKDTYNNVKHSLKTVTRKLWDKRYHLSIINNGGRTIRKKEIGTCNG